MNQFLTTALVLNESLMILKNNLIFAMKCDRQYSDQFARGGAKIGSRVTARKPPKYRGRYGNLLDAEDIQETPVDVVVDKLFGVDFEYGDVDKTLTMDNFRKRYLESAVCRIANEIDATGLQLYNQVGNFVGTPGVVPTDDEQYLNAGVKLDNTGTPRRGSGMRNMVIGSQMEATLVHGTKSLFNAQNTISDQNQSGNVKTVWGWEFGMDQNIAAHTVGALGGAALVNGANQVGSSIICDGGSNSITSYWKKGDCITFANVYGVKPHTATKTGGGQSTGQLQQFCVTDDVDTDGSGNVTVGISPPIITQGAFQTVTVSPADNAIILTFGHASSYAGLSTQTGLGFHKNSIALVTVDLDPVSNATEGGIIRDPDLGISLRMTRQFDIRTNTHPTRLEVLFGWSMMYPEMCVRVQS